MIFALVKANSFLLGLMALVRYQYLLRFCTFWIEELRKTQPNRGTSARSHGVSVSRSVMRMTSCLAV